MLDYFCEQVSCPEIPTICAKLGNLKRRITLGDYTTPKKEFDECQCLFDAIKQRAITSKNEPLANAQFVYKSYFQVFCTLSTYLGLLETRKYRSSWTILQDCLDGIKFTGKFLDIDGRKELPDLYKLLEDYESLYPYTLFASSKYIISKSHCSIYDCFYTPPELPTQKQEIEECHQALSEVLGKPERRLVLQIIDAKDRIAEDVSRHLSLRAGESGAGWTDSREPGHRLQAAAEEGAGNAGADTGGAAAVSHPGKVRGLLRSVPSGLGHWSAPGRADGATVG